MMTPSVECYSFTYTERACIHLLQINSASGMGTPSIPQRSRRVNRGALTGKIPKVHSNFACELMQCSPASSLTRSSLFAARPTAEVQRARDREALPRTLSGACPWVRYAVCCASRSKLAAGRSPGSEVGACLTALWISCYGFPDSSRTARMYRLTKFTPFQVKRGVDGTLLAVVGGAKHRASSVDEAA